LVSDIRAGDGNIANLFYSVAYYIFFTGTGVYAPPELLLSGIYSRAASTAWSLGILLYNMLGELYGWEFYKLW
jgi:hypothetical protein